MIGSKERNATSIDRKLQLGFTDTKLYVLIDTKTYTKAKSQCFHCHFGRNDQLS